MARPCTTVKSQHIEEATVVSVTMTWSPGSGESSRRCFPGWKHSLEAKVQASPEQNCRVPVPGMAGPCGGKAQNLVLCSSALDLVAFFLLVDFDVENNGYSERLSTTALGLTISRGFSHQVIITFFSDLTEGQREFSMSLFETEERLLTGRRQLSVIVTQGRARRRPSSSRQKPRRCPSPL